MSSSRSFSVYLSFSFVSVTFREQLLNWILASRVPFVLKIILLISAQINDRCGQTWRTIKYITCITCLYYSFLYNVKYTQSSNSVVKRITKHFVYRCIMYVNLSGWRISNDFTWQIHVIHHTFLCWTLLINHACSISVSAPCDNFSTSWPFIYINLLALESDLGYIPFPRCWKRKGQKNIIRCDLMHHLMHHHLNTKCVRSRALY